MQRLNATFRGVAKTTDVMSFPQQLSIQDYILGDVVINIQMAASHASKYGTGFYDEIYRLLIHGVLHLLGYDHEKSRYKARAMRKKEKELLDAVKKMG